MTATLTAPMGSLKQFLSDLRSDQALQRAVSRSSTDEILGLCEQRGVHINAALLGQLIAQMSADEELSLDQLEDVVRVASALPT